MLCVYSSALCTIRETTAITSTNNPREYRPDLEKRKVKLANRHVYVHSSRVLHLRSVSSIGGHVRIQDAICISRHHGFNASEKS